jgi:thiol-disulfide isomerase/thioredoxin
MTMTTKTFRVTAVVATALFMAACDRDGGSESVSSVPEPAPTLAAGTVETGPTAAPGISVKPDDIAWHTGTVESAFELAREQGKPVFLYWGAEWCPPCHQIKATIFDKPEFIAKSKLFVAVYLDGDTDRAQKYGDQFGVMGYPTMIVFDSGGAELTRIPGGLDIALYGEVLDLTLANIRPVSEIVTAVMAGGDVSDDDYRLLGFYSWGQDNERALAGLDPVDAFEAMASGCPADLEAASARLYAEYVRAAVAAQADEEDPRPMSDAQKQAAIERISLILADHDLSRANLPLIVGYGDDIVPGLTDAGSPERVALVAAWNQRLDALAADESTSIADRLWTRRMRIQLAKLEDPDGEVPEDVATAARAEVDRANEAARTPYQRQAYMNAAWYVLTDSGQDAYVKQLLLEELDKSKQPYYFMTNLSKLAEKQGDNEEAIAWLRKAYDTSDGQATRFEWGYYYVNGLIRMTPEDADGIAAATEELLAELDGRQDAIYNRTGRIMRRLGDRLAEWNHDGRHDEQIARIQARVDGLCAEIPTGDASLATCQIFTDEI